MGKRYGDWEVVKSLNEGGQAHVLLVKNHVTGQLAVLKRLKNIKRLERFKTELQVMQDNNDGKYFPQIYEANLEGNPPYIIMEYFERGCLSEELLSTWTLEVKIRFYKYLIEAVGFANKNGIVHRDLKPANILVTADNLPRVTDFGICFIDEAGTRQTLVDEAVGSYRYMAPEMEDGKSAKVGTHTDIYSLGKIGYWLFTGRIYNREKHRDSEYDLTLDKENKHWHHFFNDFLDQATQHNPDQRIKKTSVLLNEFNKVERAMMGQTRYLDLKVTQHCDFCGMGIYQLAAESINSGSTGIDNFGFRPVGSAKWLIFVCNTCGNVQSFRKDHARNWSWKGL